MPPSMTGTGGNQPRTACPSQNCPLLPGRIPGRLGAVKVFRGHREERNRAMRAVRFDGYGGVDVLRVVDVERPVPMCDPACSTCSTS